MLTSPGGRQLYALAALIRIGHDVGIRRPGQNFADAPTFAAVPFGSHLRPAYLPS